MLQILEFTQTRGFIYDWQSYFENKRQRVSDLDM